MPSKSRTRSDTTFDRRSKARDVPDERTEKRATRDGRQPLVVYMRQEAIKALKIAALQAATTASAIVATVVATWLQSRAKRKVAVV